MPTAFEIKNNAIDAYTATEAWIQEKLDSCDSDVNFLRTMNVSVSQLSEDAAEIATDGALEIINAILAPLDP